MIADNFELEQPPPDEEEVDDVHERLLLMDMNSSSHHPTVDNDTTFTTARGTTDDSDDVSSSNEYVEYHDILKQLRNDSEGTADTEQSFDSTGSTNNNPQRHDVAATVHADHNASSRSKEMKLLLSFVLMVVVGTGMKIFQKLQAIPYVSLTFVSFALFCSM